MNRSKHRLNPFIRTMEKWVGRVALVTGASAGIGAAVCKRLVEHGVKVVGCARNIEKIETLADSLKDSKGSLISLKCDVSKEDQILAVFEQIKNKYGGVDICINNAGLSHSAPLLTGSTEQWRQMFDINVIGLMICSREAVKSMEERRVDNGHIVLLRSITGHHVINRPDAHVYASTEFAIRAITEGLGCHIRVTCISPGTVETEFASRMYPNNQIIKEKAYSTFKALQPDDIADSIIYSLSAPVHAQVHDIIIRPTEGLS